MQKKARKRGLSAGQPDLLEQAANCVDRIRSLVHVLLALRVSVHLCLSVVGTVAAALVGLCQCCLERGRAQRIALGIGRIDICLLYTSPSPRDGATSRMPSSA